MNDVTLKPLLCLNRPVLWLDCLLGHIVKAFLLAHSYLGVVLGAHGTGGYVGSRWPTGLIQSISNRVAASSILPLQVVVVLILTKGSLWLHVGTLTDTQSTLTCIVLVHGPSSELGCLVINGLLGGGVVEAREFRVHIHLSWGSTCVDSRTNLFWVLTVANLWGFPWCGFHSGCYFWIDTLLVAVTALVVWLSWDFACTKGSFSWGVLASIWTHPLCLVLIYVKIFLCVRILNRVTCQAILFKSRVLHYQWVIEIVLIYHCVLDLVKFFINKLNSLPQVDLAVT